jgi:hypothetical protein
MQFFSLLCEFFHLNIPIRSGSSTPLRALFGTAGFFGVAVSATIRLAKHCSKMQFIDSRNIGTQFAIIVYDFGKALCIERPLTGVKDPAGLFA